ncbi:MAG: aldo/keto reductase, partial [Rhizobiaceae bacterium]
ITLSDDHLQRLEQATMLPLLNPYFIFQIPRETLFGGQAVQPFAPS